MAKVRNFLQFLIKVPHVKWLQNLFTSSVVDAKSQADGWHGLYVGRFLCFVKKAWNSRWSAVNSSVHHSVKEITSFVCAAFHCVHISVWSRTACLLCEMYLPWRLKCELTSSGDWLLLRQVNGTESVSRIWESLNSLISMEPSNSLLYSLDSTLEAAESGKHRHLLFI
jgi:hypothetical protein